MFHPVLTKEIISEVLIYIAKNMPEELKLSEDPKIIEIECQTKERPGFKA